MSFVWLMIGTLAVFRVTHLLHAEDGPWEVVVRLRRRAGSVFFGKVLDCFYCSSLWISAPFALLVAEGWKERILLWPALSAGAIVIERLTSGGRAAALYREDDTTEVEDEHLLRTGTTAAQGEPAGEPHDGEP